MVQTSKRAFKHFADLIKVLQICLMPKWHAIVTSLSLSFQFILPAFLPSQHIDCALLALQTRHS